MSRPSPTDGTFAHELNRGWKEWAERGPTVVIHAVWFLFLSDPYRATYRDGRLSILAVLAIFGWRWRKVSDAIGHERFPRAPSVRKRGPLRRTGFPLWEIPYEAA